VVILNTTTTQSDNSPNPLFVNNAGFDKLPNAELPSRVARLPEDDVSSVRGVVLAASHSASSNLASLSAPAQKVSSLSFDPFCEIPAILNSTHQAESSCERISPKDAKLAKLVFPPSVCKNAKTRSAL
jgi:hypothetical protein